MTKQDKEFFTIWLMEIGTTAGVTGFAYSGDRYPATAHAYYKVASATFGWYNKWGYIDRDKNNTFRLSKKTINAIGEHDDIK